VTWTLGRDLELGNSTVRIFILFVYICTNDKKLESNSEYAIPHLLFAMLHNVAHQTVCDIAHQTE
jgi:hypothetical protein